MRHGRVPLSDFRGRAEAGEDSSGLAVDGEAGADGESVPSVCGGSSPCWVVSGRVVVRSDGVDDSLAPRFGISLKE